MAGRSTLSRLTWAVLVSGGGALWAQPDCPATAFSLNPSTYTLPYEGGTGTFTWAKTPAAACSSTATPQVPWIALQGGSSASSSGAATFTVQQGDVSTRVGTVVIGTPPALADQTVFTLIQAGATDPVITGSSDLPGARRGFPYSIALTSASFATPPNAVVWSAESALPAGLVLTAGGLLTGAPQVGGAYVLQVTAWQPGSPYRARRAFNLNITSTAPTGFYPITPCRVMDTRVGSGKTGPFGAPGLAPGGVRDVPLPQSGCGVPASAVAYSLHVTALPPGGLSFVTLWAAGQPRPVASTLNAFDGAVTGNAAIVPAGTDGAVSVVASDRTDLILDVDGYFAPPAAGSLAYYAMTPCRVADTRLNNAVAALGGPALAVAETRTLPVRAGVCGIPATAKAYSLNVTAVPRGPLSYLALWPSGIPQPLVSTLNAFDGRVVANAAIVPADSSGQIDVYASDATDLILDVNGYFAPPGAPGALLFYPLPPCRVSDTRGGPGFTGGLGPPALGASGTRTIPMLAAPCGVPDNVRAYALNITVVPPGLLAYLAAWPTGQARPLISTLNSFLGRVVANAAIVTAGLGGNIDLFTTNPTHVIVDVNGYFAP